MKIGQKEDDAGADGEKEKYVRGNAQLFSRYFFR